MSPFRTIVLFACVTLLPGITGPARGAVDVMVGPPEVSKVAQGEQFVQSVTLSNEIARYALSYDITRLPGKPDEITSHWWAWTTGYVTLGMTGPSRANWYWQGFFNWYFDGESLYNRPARMRVVRAWGQDGMVEYAWDTPKARASVRFALTTGSDKLLMFGSFEPKGQIKRSYLRLVCYPATFAEPRNRALTTPSGTTLPGKTVNLDLARERWVLYEDTTEGRPASGSAGLLIGTPDAFSKVTIPVGGYGTVTTLELKPGARSFALGLYDFPTIPDYRRTRECFRQTASKEARLIEKMAAGNLDEPLPAMPVPDARRARLMALSEEYLDRPVDRWRPSPQPLRFPWARKLRGGPIRTVVLCARWSAYETMELARRLDLEVKHVYFDVRDDLSSPRYWPYRTATGIGPIPLPVAARHAGMVCTDSKVEVFLSAGVKAKAIPGVARRAILEQVRGGKGLVIVGSPALFEGWPDELFAAREPELAQAVLEAFRWERIPGYRPGERGRVGDRPPLEAYRYGKGRVLAFKVNLGTYSSLVPRNDASEGLEGAMDRCLALCAKAVLAASGRQMKERVAFGTFDGKSWSIPIAVSPTAPAKSTLLVRIQDDLDRELALRAVPVPLPGGRLSLPVLPTGRRCFLDVLLRDEQGDCLDLASTVLPEAGGPTLENISISPATFVHEAAVPKLELPNGGKVQCSVAVTPAAGLRGASLLWEVRDAFDRLVAGTRSPVPPRGGKVAASLALPRPVMVCHRLDVSLLVGGQERAFARQRFAMAMPYPYDDFTVLMWSYAGGEPVLPLTMRRCYELGADMMDLCHMGGYSDEGAAREYAVAAHSGLRLLPYVTRIAGSADANNYRVPCLHDPEYLRKTSESLTTTCRQAGPYSPAGFTLGDENYLFRGAGECCHRPESVRAFQAWLKDKYGTIAALNRSWAASYASFADIRRPMLLEEAAKQERSFAPWVDHKLFMDTAFARTHERFAEVIRAQVPGAKVGWDGFLGYDWRSGYDFTKLTANLDLNQVYTARWLQGELVRSFKRPDALTGKWGNRVADNEAGWSAFPWDCLLAGDNSVWWWTSWGCDYIPFNPDVSLNNYAKWFFASAREATAGPGKLLLHAKRDNSRIGVLYSQPDMFAAAVMERIVPGAVFSGTSSFWKEHEALLRGIKDLGYQYEHVSYGDLEQGKLSVEDYRVLFLTLASCLSDRQVATLRRFVESGGTLVVDGRAGLLSGEGRIRDSRPLDDLLGVKSQAGLAAVKQPAADSTVTAGAELSGVSAVVPIRLRDVSVTVLEPGLKASTGKALGAADETPIMIVNQLVKGRTVYLNVALTPILEGRTKDAQPPLMELLSAVLRSAGLAPYCELRGGGGAPPRCVQQILFTDGNCTCQTAGAGDRV